MNGGDEQTESTSFDSQSKLDPATLVVKKESEGYLLGWGSLISPNTFFFGEGSKSDRIEILHGFTIFKALLVFRIKLN